MKTYEIEKAASEKNIEELSCFTEKALAELGLPEEERQAFMMAVDEAVTNIIMYAYIGKNGDMKILVSRNGDEISIELIDSGMEFDPTKQPEPNFDIPVEDRPPGGMGLPLMRGFTNSLKYFRKNSHNHFILTKKIGGQNG